MPLTTELTAGLERIRATWESARGSVAIFHKESLGAGCHITLLEYPDDEPTTYIVLRYFLLGDTWQASKDIQTTDMREAWLKAMESFT